jgi:hypothetical protein
MNIEKLVKCLELTRSSNINEILSATTKANSMVSSWEDIINDNADKNKDNQIYDNIKIKYANSEIERLEQQIKDLKTFIYILIVIIIICVFSIYYLYIY